METFADDEAAKQLQNELQSSLHGVAARRRPVLTHLNADTTWLLSLPYPEDAVRPVGRTRFNILIDPWLAGPQADVADWFSTQWHVIKSSVESIAQLNEHLREAETHQLDDASTYALPESNPTSFVDAVAISHEFTDHCHRATLLEVDSRVPVFATTTAASRIRSWKHFDTVVEMPGFTEGQDWRTTSLAPLPDWLGISRLVTKTDALYYHSAVILCFKPLQPCIDTAEAVIYSPHGVKSTSLSVIATARPELRTLAFLHGLHDVSIAWGQQLNLGAVNAIEAQKILRSKYWIGTHDEVKRGAGLVSFLLRRKVYTVSEALDLLKSLDKNSEAELKQTSWYGDINCVEMQNGESLLLQ